MNRPLDTRIAWFVPDPIRGSGGHRTIFQHIKFLSEIGYKNTVFIDAEDTYPLLKDKVNELFDNPPCSVKTGLRADDTFDVAIATAWWTAAEVARHHHIAHKFYFVQDFEAYFNPIGSNYLRAIDSYRYGLHPITIGRWLTHKLSRDFGARALHFDFGVDHAVYQNKDHGRENAVCILFQSDKPRRCTELLTEAIFAIRHHAPDTTIYTYGQDDPPPVPGVLHQGLLTRPELSKLYNRCSVGVCLSATNPSRIPFEMMACGLPVVDLHMENNLYDHKNGAALLASPDPYSVAEAVLQLMEDHDGRQSRGEAGLSFVAKRSEENECAGFLRAFEAVIAGGPISNASVEPSYTDPPIFAGQIVEPTVSPVRLPTPSQYSQAGIEADIAGLRDEALSKASVASVIVASGADDLDASLERAQPKLISCDLWDTLLYRTVHPDEVKLRTAKILLERFYGLLKPYYQDAYRLLALRRAQEYAIGRDHLAAGLDDEYAIGDVFTSMLEEALIAPDGRALKDDAHSLVDCEIDMEVDVAQVDRACEKAVMRAAQGRSIVIVSDFYMPAEALTTICDRLDMRLEPAAVLSSCDVNLNKRSGRLFEHLCKAFDVAPGDVLHIGDNAHSDIRSAQQNQLKTFHYSPAPNVKRRHDLAEEWVNRFEGRAKEPLKRIRAIDRTPPPVNHAEQMRRLGQACAPAFIGYADFTAHMARCWRAEKLHFFTREGVFLKQVFDLRQTQLGTDDAFHTNLLPISRVATFLPSLKDVSINALMRVWNQYSTQSVNDMMRTLNCGDIDVRPFLADDCDPDQAIRYPWTDKRVQALFSDPAFLDQIKVRRDRAHKGLTALLAEQGLQFDGDNMVVDIGWRGTIQDNLAHAYPKATFRGVYVGLQRFLNEQPANAEKHAFVIDMNANNTRFANILDVVRPIEMLSNSLGGSVIGYRATDGEPVAVDKRTVPGEDAVFHAFTSHFQQGVLETVEAWPDQPVWERPAIREWMATAGHILRQLLHDPPYVLALADGQLHHNEVFGLGSTTSSMDVDALTWLRAIADRSVRGTIMDAAYESGWPQGFLRRQMFGLPLRWAQRRGRFAR